MHFPETDKFSGQSLPIFSRLVLSGMSFELVIGYFRQLCLLIQVTFSWSPTLIDITDHSPASKTRMEKIIHKIK